MKPECRRAVERIAALSADELTPAEAELVRRHLEECPPCKGQWVLFKRTLSTLDTTAQPLVEESRSHEMWLVCLEHARRHSQAGPKQVLPVVPASHGAQVVRRPFWAAFREEGLSGGWFGLSPASRLGFAMAGTAAILLGAAYLYAPNPAGPTRQIVAQVLPPMPGGDPGPLVQFQRPPSQLSPLLGHHAAISFDPYADHVGPAIVSYSAVTAANSAPAENAPRP